MAGAEATCKVKLRMSVRATGSLQNRRAFRGLVALGAVFRFSVSSQEVAGRREKGPARSPNTALSDIWRCGFLMRMNAKQVVHHRGADLSGVVGGWCCPQQCQIAEIVIPSYPDGRRKTAYNWMPSPLGGEQQSDMKHESRGANDSAANPKRSAMNEAASLNAKRLGLLGAARSRRVAPRRSIDDDDIRQAQPSNCLPSTASAV